MLALMANKIDMSVLLCVGQYGHQSLAITVLFQRKFIQKRYLASQQMLKMQMRYNSAIFKQKINAN